MVQNFTAAHFSHDYTDAKRKSTRKMNPWNFEYGIIGSHITHPISQQFGMGLLTETQNCGLRIRRECRERFPRQRKPLFSDPVMHHGTFVTHVQWCMSGSLTHCGGEDVFGNPGAILRIWQEAHARLMHHYIDVYYHTVFQNTYFLNNISLHFRIKNHSIDFIYMISIMLQSYVFCIIFFFYLGPL